MILKTILLLLVLWCPTKAYKILILHPTPSYSHQLPAMALTEGLVKKGHQVYAVTPNVVPGLKNYTYVDVAFSYKYFNDHSTEKGVNLQQELSKFSMIPLVSAMGDCTAEQYRSDAFLQFQKHVKNENLIFDVIVIESFYIPFGCAMAQLLGSGRAPIVTFATMANGEFYGEDSIGSIAHPSYSPFILSSYTDRMGVLQRIENWLSHLYLKYKIRQAMEDSARRFFKDDYGAEYESLIEGCWSNVSLSIISSNSLYYYPRLLSPNVIELGALHIKPPEKLPEVLQNWLDGADQGVVYLSLGSNMLSDVLPDAVLSNFFRVFSELPNGYRVIWKLENDSVIQVQLENVLLQKWLPQQSLLAHSKVKLFITQGGFQSFQETVHYGVPTVGIPWFADQDLDVAKMVDAGIGVRLWPHELVSYEKIKSAIHAVLFDKRYVRNMKRLSAISKDFTSRAVDEGVFWVEHVARHGGASHLRPSTADTTFFEFLALDVIAVISLASVTFFYTLFTILRFLISVVLSRPRTKLKSS